MTWADPQQNGDAYDIRSVGPVTQTAPILASRPANIAAAGSWQSGILPASGYKVLAVGLTSTQAGAVTIQRYLDQAGDVAQGAAATQPLTAATPAVLNVMDGLPFASFEITITNTGAAAAVVSNFAALMNAA